MTTSELTLRQQEDNSVVKKETKPGQEGKFKFTQNKPTNSATDDFSDSDSSSLTESEEEAISSEEDISQHVRLLNSL